MKVDNNLSHLVDTTNEYENPTQDACIKKFLELKIIIAYILSRCVEEFKDINPFEIVDKYIKNRIDIKDKILDDDITEKYTDKIDSENSSLKDGLIRFDSLFRIEIPKKEKTKSETTSEDNKNTPAIKVMINIEPQVNFTPGYSITKRAAYYMGRMISSQKGTVFTKSDYGKIEKVYSIWICPKVTGKFRNTITRYKFQQESIVGNAEYPTNEYDLMESVIVGIGAERDGNYTDLIKLLGTFFNIELDADGKKKIIKEEFNIPITKEVEEVVEDMGELAYAYYMDGIQVGTEKGREEGRQEEREANILKTIELLREMCPDLNKEQIATKVAEKYTMPIDIILGYME